MTISFAVDRVDGSVPDDADKDPNWRSRRSPSEWENPGCRLVSILSQRKGRSRVCTVSTEPQETHELVLGGKATTNTEAAVKDTMRMTGCGSCGMYMILEGVPEKSFVCMKCRLIELMEEKIRGLEMQVETLVEFRRAFKRMVEQRHKAEGKSSDLQMEAGPKNSEGRLLDEESGRWKHVTKRTRQRKRWASAGEIELRNKFAELENEEGHSRWSLKVTGQGRREEQLVL
ncbi:uncharacterized protein LOC127030987 [Gopherus flavomarginatus]|uniref:uncharacterized protein LOC127030987 n=1 Tax=Gopherus flavomarginatus TaxID=286002 RepID=UPI0021CBC6AC|nr:uncharacterized protein LOC127030987 [Gopherus flavomarginatus]